MLIYSFVAVFSLSLELSPSIYLTSQQHPDMEWDTCEHLGTVMQGFLQQAGEFLLPNAWACEVRTEEHFHKAKKLKMKMHWRSSCYLQDSEVLEPSKVHLGNPGDIISVQVTAMESKFRSDFCRLLPVSSTQTGLDWEATACPGEGNCNDWWYPLSMISQLAVWMLFGISHSLLCRGALLYLSAWLLRPLLQLTNFSLAIPPSRVFRSCHTSGANSSSGFQGSQEWAPDPGQLISIFSPSEHNNWLRNGYMTHTNNNSLSTGIAELQGCPKPSCYH